ncbi:MAG: hypothetical protein R2874_13430 [Desulfobacterales bacterium]
MRMKANIVGRFDDLCIAEAPVMRTWMQGKTLAETRLRKKPGVTVVGVWEQGKFEILNGGHRDERFHGVAAGGHAITRTVLTRWGLLKINPRKLPLCWCWAAAGWGRPLPWP